MAWQPPDDLDDILKALSTDGVSPAESFAEKRKALMNASAKPAATTPAAKPAAKPIPKPTPPPSPAPTTSTTSGPPPPPAPGKPTAKKWNDPAPKAPTPAPAPAPAPATAPAPKPAADSGYKYGPTMPTHAPCEPKYPPGPNKHDRATLSRKLELSTVSNLVPFELGQDLSYFPAEGSSDYQKAVENTVKWLKALNGCGFDRVASSWGQDIVTNNVSKAVIVHTTSPAFGFCENDIIYFLRDFTKLASEGNLPRSLTDSFEDMIYSLLWTYVSPPDVWIPLKSKNGDEGVMIPEIRKLTGNPDLQFYFDWGCTMTGRWCGYQEYSEQDFQKDITLDAMWLPGLVQMCTQYPKVAAGLGKDKKTKNIVFKFDMNNKVKSRTGGLYWRSFLFSPYPDTMTFELDYSWLFGDRMNAVNKYAIRTKLMELPKAKEWKYQWMTNEAIDDDNAAYNARQSFINSLPLEKQQFYQR